MRNIECFFIGILLFFGPLHFACAAAPGGVDHPKTDFPKPLSEYQDDQTPQLLSKLVNRAKIEPFNVVASLIFLCAIIHTFLTSRLMHISHRYHHEFQALELQESKTAKDPAIAARRDVLLFRAQLFHFMGEVEAVFGIWLIPLFIAIILMKGWPKLVAYITSLSPAEPV